MSEMVSRHELIDTVARCLYDEDHGPGQRTWETLRITDDRASWDVRNPYLMRAQPIVDAIIWRITRDASKSPTMLRPAEYEFTPGP